MTHGDDPSALCRCEAVRKVVSVILCIICLSSDLFYKLPICALNSNVEAPFLRRKR